jgi:hypothetical protein
MKQNDTTTILTLGDGDNRRNETLPTTILTSEDATILCHYRAFLDAHELRESIYCDECAGPPDRGAKIARGDSQVAVFCPHRVWFFQGALPKPSTYDLTAGPIIQPGHALRVTLTDEDLQVTLGESTAKLLRAYKRLCQKYGWKEALDCRTCWANGQPEGMRAFVTDDRIAFICRHRTLAYVGQTA